MKDDGSVPANVVFQSARLDRWRVLLLSPAEHAGISVLPGCGCFGLFGRLPFVRQQRFELMPFGLSGHHAFKYIGQPGQRFDTVQFRALDERRDDGPVPSAIVVAGKKRILSAM